MRLKNKRTPEGRAWWKFAERTAVEVKAEMAVERQKMTRLTRDTPEGSPMTRLEQIRERVKNTKRYNSQGLVDPDVSYLLALVDQARDALKQIADWPQADMFTSLAPAVSMKAIAADALRALDAEAEVKA